jgi:hypothetical protein
LHDVMDGEQQQLAAAAAAAATRGSSTWKRALSPVSASARDAREICCLFILGHRYEAGILRHWPRTAVPGICVAAPAISLLVTKHTADAHVPADEKVATITAFLPHLLPRAYAPCSKREYKSHEGV